MAKKKKVYTSGEKKSFLKGFFFGLFRSKRKKSSTGKKTVIRTKTSGALKEYSFIGFNANCDCFNVFSYGRTRDEALRNARKHLKHDPEVPSWDVKIGEGQADPNFFRKITVGKDGRIKDNWEPYYRY